MTIEEELKQLILKRYKSLRAFTTEIDIPYSTIDTMLKRGIGGTSISTAVKVCNALNIDANKLINNELKEKKEDIYSMTSDHEKELINIFNLLNKNSQESLITISKELLKLQNELLKERNEV